MNTHTLSAFLLHKLKIRAVRGGVIFGIGIGAITMCIRLWGAYPEGMSFAILIMNACVPLINKYVKPKRFGVK